MIQTKTQEYDILDDECPPLETIVTLDDAPPDDSDILKTEIDEFNQIDIDNDVQPEKK